MPKKKEDLRELTPENQKRLDELNNKKGLLSEKEQNELKELEKQRPKEIGNNDTQESQITSKLKELSVSPKTSSGEEKTNSEERKNPRPKRNRRKKTRSTIEGMFS